MARAGTERRSEAQALVERLRERRNEIEKGLLNRVYAISDPAEVGDPEYALGLRTAVTAALAYALECLCTSEAQRPPLPAELPAQARAAARAGVSLDTVLRRYFAGYTLLTDCLVREAQMGNADLPEAMRAQAELFDCLVAAVTEAYAAEEAERRKGTKRRRSERVKQLLQGELVNTSELGYELEGWHLALLAVGPGAPEALRGLAVRLDRQLLAVPGPGRAIWAWLGGKRRVEAAAVGEVAGELMPGGALLALGEPGLNLAGWRLSHRQATAALPIALRSPERLVLYSEVCLLAALIQDEVLLSSLDELYLAPLQEGRDNGRALRETLGAYLQAEQNVSSAAAMLGVSRKTVAGRLRTVEERIGRRLGSCIAELEMTLSLKSLGEKDSQSVLLGSPGDSH